MSRTVLFANIYTGDLEASRLHLIYDRAGQPIVERINGAANGWVADAKFPYGYPMNSEVRYFPSTVEARDAGFLLRVFPTRLTKLPLGPEGIRVPSVGLLAGIAPDGKAYAYVDSQTTPSAVVVVDANKTIHDPIPIPLTSLAVSAQPADNPFEPVWRWFALGFAWQKGQDGRWGIKPTRVRAGISAPNPVEEPFIDAVIEYQTCFASNNPICLQGWRLQLDNAAYSSDCCLSRYVYAPTRPTRAFDADVVAIVYSKSTIAESGYQLLVTAAPDRVIAALSKRLQSRKVPFVRTDECPTIAISTDACIAAVNQSIHWKKTPIGDELLSPILTASANTAVFVTPTVAFAVYADPNGRTWIDTLARYDLSADANAIVRTEHSSVSP